MADPRPARELPPYSGHDAACPKCQVSPVGTYWHYLMGGSDHPRGRFERWPCSHGRYTAREHLCRVCTNCGYQWSEAVADQQPNLRAIPDD